MTSRTRSWPILLAAFALLLGIGIYFAWPPAPPETSESGRPAAQAIGNYAPMDATAAHIAEVATLRVEPGEYQASITAFGEASPHFSLELSAAVAGTITSINTAFESGGRVVQGDVLLKLEDTGYQAAVSSANKALADARLALLEEQRQGLQAETEWKASGLDGQPDSALVLRKPQLAAAQSAVSTARAELTSAREDLARTAVKAPFDSLIVERVVAPGAYVQAGTKVATLYSTDRIEIKLSLSARDWQNLPNDLSLATGDWEASLTEVETGEQWTGRVLRTALSRDETTRQRSLVIAVDNPLDQQTPLLAGSFVQARIAGIRHGGLWKLPMTAMSQRGEVWYVTSDGLLEKFEASTAFSDAEHIYVRVPESLATSPQRVLVHPLNGYLAGMSVNAVEGAADE